MTRFALAAQSGGSLFLSLFLLGACSGPSTQGTAEVDAGPYEGTYPSSDDFAAKGPFDTTTGPNPPDCTIYRPASLGDGGKRHPVILWGNGTETTPQIYADALNHWASHGFIVAAANTSNAGSGREMLGCLDYLTDQDAKEGSVFARAVDLDRVGASGHSQGGAGAIMAGSDERVTVTAPVEPYIGSIPLGGTFDQGSISKQKGPMFLMSGSKDNIAVPSANQKPVYDGTNVPVFWGTLQGADHITTAIGNIGGFRGPATAWFRLHLMGDTRAHAMFYGPLCELCTNTGWDVKRKDIE